jgi:hypothetical protein
MDDGTWYSVDSIGALGTLSTGYPLHSPTEISAAGSPGAPGFLGGAAQDKESADSIGSGGEQRYETMPYEAAVDLLGRPSAVVWMRRASGGAPEAVLEEVTKDGRTVALGSVRGRMRTMLSGPGGPARWEFVGFPFVARRTAVGSRIRLTLRGVRGAVVLHEIESYSRVDLPLVGTGRKSRSPGG